ncbi:MAG: hypothetical protein H0V67_07260 [Geodermatophilaceae bacterium]|nr:hypothetical protein [Geodermatophilaceae bacterium]
MARLLGKVLAAVVAAAVGAALALQGAEVWSASDSVVVALIVTAAVLAAGSTGISAGAEFRARRLGERREFADVVLTATHWAIADASGFGYRDLGLAAYRVQRVWWAPAGQRLVRVHRRRAQSRQVATSITWAPGKGVIGSCVSQQQVVATDLRAIWDAMWPCTEHEWNTVAPPEARLGLSYAEFVDVRDKYDVVVAAPMLDDTRSVTRTVGCVALDGPSGSLDRLSADDILRLLDSAARSLLHQGR